MYFFVPYNISPIQQAIQAGHAALEYAHKYRNDPGFISFVKNDKTWIILNGGTTNTQIGEDGRPFGTLNQIHEDLWSNQIEHSIFFEPDLNDALSAVCFLADERVWDYENYPDFYEWSYQKYFSLSPYTLKKMTSLEAENLYPEYFKEWINTIIGNRMNLYLRDLIRGKKLA